MDSAAMYVKTRIGVDKDRSRIGLRWSSSMIWKIVQAAAS
jgi:hypothetical protein